MFKTKSAYLLGNASVKVNGVKFSVLFTFRHFSFLGDCVANHFQSQVLDHV